MSDSVINLAASLEQKLKVPYKFPIKDLLNTDLDSEEFVSRCLESSQDYARDVLQLNEEITDFCGSQKEKFQNQMEAAHEQFLQVSGELRDVFTNINLIKSE